MRTKQATVLLSLPDELFIYHIFIYLRSTDLLYSFGQLYNQPMNSLVCAHVRHIDLLTTNTPFVPIDKWLSYISYLKKATLSLRTDLEYFDYSLSFLFSRLDLQLTATTHQNISRLSSFTQLRKLSITSTATKAEKNRRIGLVYMAT
ncbi:unnamed protein product [Adineta ricciae]|uniref:Uncharacterized protein n=1 Tax=Adineta ricciae TaxID=249248 RepID=A0A814S821_ADIRI|nr:unnamed protein product [Adineta ricciae]CAF1447549.1 unnamed protein product [Adineta ricciae]